MVLNVLLQSTDAARDAAFAALEAQLVAGRRRYEGAKELGEAMFGNEPEAAYHGRMQRLAASLLIKVGALPKSIEPGGLEVPAPAAHSEGVEAWANFSRFGFGSWLPTGTQQLGIESDWLDRFLTVVDDCAAGAARCSTLVPARLS